MTYHCVLSAKKYKSYYTSMTHLVCCSIWRSSWHFNSLFQWLYSRIKYSYHTYTLSFQLKRLPVSDLVRCIVVCQTDAYPSVKLLPEQRNRQPLISHNRIADRPTSDVSAVRLSAIEIKALISSIYDSIRNLSLLQQWKF